MRRLICALALATAPTIAAAQQDPMTTTDSGTTKANACDASINMARDQCRLRGLNNITKVKCECVQETSPETSPGVLKWNCKGIVECQK
jgi:hypothetical protein